MGGERKGLAVNFLSPLSGSSLEERSGQRVTRTCPHWRGRLEKNEIRLVDFKLNSQVSSERDIVERNCVGPSSCFRSLFLAAGCVAVCLSVHLPPKEHSARCQTSVEQNLARVRLKQ